jgi:UDP:flavonoid glycosyltransferase YjiC (YdhE family)
MRDLGVARSLPWSRASPTALQRELALLLSSAGYRKRAASIATSLQQERGLKQTIDAIEHLVA